MPKKVLPFEDLLRFADRTIGAFLDSHHSPCDKTCGIGEDIARKLGLVTRDEFDAAFAMLAKARATQEDLDARLRSVEAKLNKSSAQAKARSMKPFLRSVKHKKRKAKRN